jgi:hypothetical protein
MGIRTISATAVTALALTSCGATGGKSPTLARPASPINLSVYVNDSSVSVSPASVGAGPIVFIVTNQSSRSQALAISRGSDTVASTAPINPQGTTQVTVNITPGNYTVGAAPRGQTDAQLTQQSSIRSASIHVGRQRSSSGNQLLQP